MQWVSLDRPSIIHSHPKVSQEPPEPLETKQGATTSPSLLAPLLQFSPHSTILYHLTMAKTAGKRKAPKSPKRKRTGTKAAEAAKRPKAARQAAARSGPASAVVAQRVIAIGSGFSPARRIGPTAPLTARHIVYNSDDGALDIFFAQYRSRGFVYDSTQLPPAEFRRLQEHLDIKRDDPESKPLWGAFGKAMYTEFSMQFGRDVDDLEAWQKLCKRIGIEPLPETLAQARKVCPSPVELSPYLVRPHSHNLFSLLW